MDIVIVSPFSGDFSESDNDRFLYLANLLSAHHDVEIVTSSFLHTAKQQRKEPVSGWPFSVTYVEEPGYPRNVSLQRLLSHWRFSKNLKKYLSGRKVPDVIYCAFPPVGSADVAADYCKQHDVRFVVDIQDLWPEAFKIAFDVPVVSDILFAPMERKANKVFRAADALCAVSSTYASRAFEANPDRKTAEVVFLGTDLGVFDSDSEVDIEIEKAPGELWLGYCGTLGTSYDLTTVLDALAILAQEGKQPPLFIVMGDGPRKGEFEAYAAERGVGAAFVGRLPYDQMRALLKQCDIAVNPIAAGAAQSIINKHGDYAAAGLPVLNTQESPEYQTLVSSYDMGLNVANGDAQELAEQLWYLCQNDDARHSMGESARRCAEELFDRRRSYGKLVEAIEEREED